MNFGALMKRLLLKSNLGRKEMKPEPLLELTGLTHLKEK
jgi:hypothetical protein